MNLYRGLEMNKSEKILMEIAIAHEDLENYPDYDRYRLFSILTSITGCGV